MTILQSLAAATMISHTTALCAAFGPIAIVPKYVYFSLRLQLYFFIDQLLRENIIAAKVYQKLRNTVSIFLVLIRAKCDRFSYISSPLI